jgi:enterochelin esterase-like enzyme
VLVTEVEGDDVVVRYDDPQHSAGHVGVWANLPLGDTAMRRVDGGWEVRLSDLPVDRLEYLLDVDGSLRPDPSNPRTTGGPFGDHSWVALPAYREPRWLQQPTIESTRTPLVVARTAVGRIDSELWAPAATTAADPLPLLVSHDGPEMDAYAGLTSYVGAMIAGGQLPPMRVALVSPGRLRNKRYAANPAYARALTARVLPAIRDQVAVAGRPVLMGASLGALAALHAGWTSEGTFAGLFLQSGSFFTPRLDRQESGFEFWREVTGFVESVRAATRHRGGEPREQRRDAEPPGGTGPRHELGRAARRPHLDLLARHPGPTPHRALDESGGLNPPRRLATRSRPRRLRPW